MSKVLNLFVGIVLTSLLLSCASRPSPSLAHQLPIAADKLTPAFSILKTVEGRVSFSESQGVRSINHAAKVTGNDRWHLGSCTKSMTAYLIAILNDQAKLSFNDKVSRFFPRSVVRRYGELRIKDLLDHRSGLADISEAQLKPFFSPQSDTIEQQRVTLSKEVLATPPKFRPDEKFDYSNSNYLLLGAIIEQVTQSTWESNIAEHIFKPLGMSSCGFGAPATRDLVPPDAPWGHHLVDGKLASVPPRSLESDPSDNPAVLAPAGSINCTLPSWQLFIHEMLSASLKESKLLKPATASFLFEAFKDGVARGGWGAKDRPWANGITFTMVGSNTLNFAVFVIAPARRMTLLGASNSGEDSSLDALQATLKELTQ